MEEGIETSKDKEMKKQGFSGNAMEKSSIIF